MQQIHHGFAYAEEWSWKYPSHSPIYRYINNPYKWLQISNSSKYKTIVTNEKPDNKGNGLTRVLTNGKVFEQAGVNYSIVHGDDMPASATALRPEL
jgi:hypothetical protein